MRKKTMAVSTERPSRRRRYTRQPQEGLFTLTPQKVVLLRYIADYGIVSLPQLALLTELSPKSSRRHLRELFDRGLVEVIAVARVALAEPARGLNDPSLLYGSAPNLYQITSAGLRALDQLGLAEETWIKGERYGPRNGLFLAHELLIRDVRVWFELSARKYPNHELEVWHDGAMARVDLGERQLCPDAWLVYRFEEKRLVALVEVDRGTERGGQRWREKLEAYAELYQAGRLRAALGYQKARVVVVTPDARRRDRLGESIAQWSPPPLAARFWLAGRGVLSTPGLSEGGWQQPGSKLLGPLVPRWAGKPEGTGEPQHLTFANR
jgi:hypothetical protein